MNTSGSLTMAMNAREEQELTGDLGALKRLEVPASHRETTEDTPFPARYHPEDGLVSPPDVLLRLANLADESGAVLATKQPVQTIHSQRGTLQVQTPGHTIEAHMALLCAGPALRNIDPFYDDKLYSVRSQFVAGPGQPPGAPCAATGQQGHLIWRPLAAGTMMAGGCRWATPHLETGETDDLVISSAVDARLSDVATKQLGMKSITHRWSTIAAYTCDGLPIIGPLPGRVSLISCTGWNGRPWSLAMRAAQAVCDGILGRATKGLVPQMMSARRFL
jgi:glycine/D-amino acid oxidase-like deaminating enzyme